ncbi:2-succinyl-5-enolpyruvyl-6-hydroxy-3-cyclohexene-1-carboxylic-acid synthase [Aquimarina sp. ERC-38]|uniref:2-succinyl-5-enolpyruvyl-6-hydroxy-3- cyclohexene-1-carboxylic-acid synthase n=1 Tax=Aquimarina sp. ERC-38 TaxID=2949996 RepID=UPI0022462BEA|nr:2-succinyl-5-enolpyruvyl-6-hydroxy-3-cyclohexene-1-carboxylic-acid synthase [Aquimarina sp. ERC-38]UZO79522.1 2-succinyl-5-enolpyruvyl-6-hydroxy-3-cyclohexene-1-carboxylic-acid synthase [Aquimarina sp. ERC-38]
MATRIYSAIPLSQTIVALCAAKEISNIVISPGSRNAPLIIEFSNHPDMNCYSIVDERCAAFFALGMAQQLQKPTALVCTSGSALLNYYPAIAEAFYSDIPLIVLSADRPIERIDIGDGQTIRQKNAFEKHILYSANLYSEIVPQEPSTDIKILQKQKESQKHNEREINLAINKAITHQGPVHINIPFYEPLYNTTTKALVTPKSLPLKKETFILSEEVKNDMLARWNKATRKIILIGVNHPDPLLNMWMDYFAKDSSVLVLTETTSNVHHQTHIQCIDRLITPLTTQEFKELQPEILITFGGMVVSKRIKAFLRKYQPETHWHIDPIKAFDTYFCLTEHIKEIPSVFFSYFFNTNVRSTSGSYKQHWLAIDRKRAYKQKEYEATIPFSDFKAYQLIFERIPHDMQIQLSNSSTIRYAQLFPTDPSHTVFCNRGTSGIDGSTSTAIGAALYANREVTLITGDLSFFYDSNALWNAYIPATFRIILINNSGGGIFRILPGKEESESFKTFFETVHHLTAEHLCKMFNFTYHQAKNEEEVIKGLQSLYSSAKRPKLLEIITSRTVNDKVLLDYFKNLC